MIDIFTISLKFWCKKGQGLVDFDMYCIVATGRDWRLIKKVSLSEENYTKTKYNPKRREITSVRWEYSAMEWWLSAVLNLIDILWILYVLIVNRFQIAVSKALRVNKMLRKTETQMYGIYLT